MENKNQKRVWSTGGKKKGWQIRRVQKLFLKKKTKNKKTFCSSPNPARNGRGSKIQFDVMSVLWFWEMVPQWHASTRHRLLLPVRENKMAALLFFFFFWQDANIGWGVWKLMTRLLFITTWWPNLEHTNLSKNATRFDLTKVSMLHLRQANFSGRSSVIFTFEWSAAHRYLRAPWEGERGYFEKMFLKAAYFQTNHSPAAEHDKWRSHSRKKYFGKFYLGTRVLSLLT